MICIRCHKHLLSSLTYLLFLTNCHVPTPTMNIIYCQVIPVTYCQGQRTYLIDVGLVYANKTGHTGEWSTFIEMFH
ncbi:hypothetical protein SAMN05216167_13435 [Spirosoma endophyticum]|uniref:Uncharacterized protein n=1 Tax=Spirosoma endophyticum TaxID=662367 RepID=A0A1I2GSE9_9BACT|nr:hypothetical protein SAMN05216167_13435 [Spirosoma endophyticum]